MNFEIPSQINLFTPWSNNTFNFLQKNYFSWSKLIYEEDVPVPRECTYVRISRYVQVCFNSEIISK